MVHHITLTPLRTVGAGPLGAVQRSSSQVEDLNAVRPQLGECLLCEELHTSQAQEIKGNDSDGMLAGVVSKIIVGSLHLFGVSSTQDEVVRLGFLQQLFNRFKALVSVLNIVCSVHVGGRTRPDEAPVAMTVFALVDIFA